MVMDRMVRSWKDAEAFAARVVPELSESPDARPYQVLARRLLAAAAWYAATTNGSAQLDLDTVQRAVSAELSVDPDDVPERPLSACPDRRVTEAVEEVRRRGRGWVAVAAHERNAAAWIAADRLAAGLQPVGA
jgi:hypothetical protein